MAIKSSHLKTAFGELLLVVVTLAFSVGYKPPPRLKTVMTSPEFVAATVFAVLYTQLGQDTVRAGLWSIAFIFADRLFREE